MNTTLRFKLLLVPLFLTFATSLQAAKVNAVAPSFLAQSATPQQTSETTWHEIISDTGDFSVLMPGQPEEIQKSFPTASPLATITMRMFFVGRAHQPGDTTTAVYNFFDITDPRLPIQLTASQRDEYLNNAINGLLAEPGRRLLNEQPLSLDGNPGREIEIEVEGLSQLGPIVMRMRVYAVNQKLYLLQVGGSPELMHSPEAERFLNSFKRLSSTPNQ